MLTLMPERLVEISLPLETGWLLSSCMEAKGKQDLWTRQKPEVLKVLREQAIIQSTESSNRIEGVTVPVERLRPIVLGKSKPQDRSEEEIAGYKKALDWIFFQKHAVRMTPAVIRRLHAFAQGGFSGDAGKWKSKDNEIIELLSGGGRQVRFKPVSAKETPRSISQLCVNYEESCSNKQIPPLTIIAAFVFDFLCIHPFRDGNGRVSRLLTTLLLQRHGFRVAQYISLERLVEETKENYYRVLGKCSQGWHEGKNEIIPWWNYFLGILRRAYGELQRQVEFAEARPAKSELIQRAVLSQVAPFTLADLIAQFPSASSQLIKKVLAELKRRKKIRLKGRGRGAQWEKI